MNRISVSQTHTRALFILVVLWSSSLPTRAFADFNYPNFSSPIGLSLVQDASYTSGMLRLTPASANKLGAAWHLTRQLVLEPFETAFQFRISELSSGQFAGADGFAFVIQNQHPSAIGGGPFGGSSLAYHGIPNCIAVEFDTYGIGPGDFFGDPNDNHLSVHTRGSLPNDVNETYSLGNTGTSLAANLSDGSVHDVVIRYQDETLKVFLDGSASPALAVSVNLATTLTLLNGTAFVGFTGATGSAYENHDILSWSFRTIPEPATVMMLAIGAGLMLTISRPAVRTRKKSTIRVPDILVAFL